MRKIKITGDGTVTGTRVRDAETGEEIDNCTAVYFKHEVGAIPEAVLHFQLVEIEVDGVVETTTLHDETRSYKLNPALKPKMPEPPPLRYVREDGENKQ